MPEDLRILGEMIRLGQLLKLAGVVQSGADTKALLEQGGVTVNGEAESRRGRQLHDGDVVSVGEQEFRVTSRSHS
jgi:ribosome-associated protein